jgi:hypothetical protein
VVQESLSEQELIWLPTPGRWGFRADPFGIWNAGRLYVFVERFDYPDPRGWIEVLTYSATLELLSIDPALREPWHLSYPYVFTAGGEHWMVPEARDSGRLTLYRAKAFPSEWAPELTIPVDSGAVDATPLFWNGKWWLFYSVRQRKPEKANQLHVAFADELAGPWRPHPLNPVLVGVSNGRPGGSPCVGETFIDLPVQDGTGGYGSALRRLRITALDEQRFAAEDQPWLRPPPGVAPFDDGLHTLSSAGEVSLIDFKRVDRSPIARLLDARMKMAKRRVSATVPDAE